MKIRINGSVFVSTLCLFQGIHAYQNNSDSVGSWIVASIGWALLAYNDWKDAA